MEHVKIIKKSQSLEITHKPVLEAYAEGVNSYLSKQKLLPVEFQVLDYQPESWHSEDSILVSLGMFQLLNECYDGLYGFSEITARQIQRLTKQFFGVINPEYISLIKDHAGQLIAFGIIMPSMSEALKKINGKLFPFGFLTLTRALKKNDTIDLLLIGIKPEFQNKGLNAIIFNLSVYKSYLFSRIELEI